MLFVPVVFVDYISGTVWVPQVFLPAIIHHSPKFAASCVGHIAIVAVTRLRCGSFYIRDMGTADYVQWSIAMWRGDVSGEACAGWV